MKKRVIRNLALALFAAFTIWQLPATAQAQSQVPFAYVDNAGNVVMGPAQNGTGTPVTQDANFKFGQTEPIAHGYTHLRWSPDATKLAFQDYITGNLFVVTPGQAPNLVASKVAVEYPSTWLPDSSAVAFVMNTGQSTGGNDQSMAIQQVSPDGGTPTTVGGFTQGVGCGGGGSDASYILYMHETALNGNFQTFAWTKNGWLYSTACTGSGIALNNFNNQQFWRIDNLGRVVVAPNGTQAAGVLFDQNHQPSSLIYVDLATGRNGALNAGSAVDQVGWSADGNNILYSTIDGQNVSLWKIPVQGTQATQLFADQGKYIGVITGTPASDSAVFSYIPAGDNPQTQTLLVPLNVNVANRSTASLIANGGQPAFGIASQSTTSPTAVPANTVAPAVAKCAPRADWTINYTVAPGDTVSSLARRTGSTVDALATGNCLANASIIFVGQVLRVPVAPPPIPSNIVKRIVFPVGATSVVVRGQVAASTDSWVLRGQAGQTMTAQITFSSRPAILAVIGTDGTVLQSDHAALPTFTGVLPTTQDYFINVPSNGQSIMGYTLTITILPGSAPPPPVAKRIVFPAGATVVSVQGTVAATATDRWVLAAQAGQTMTAQLTFASGQAILIVYGADGNVLQSDHATSPTFSGRLPITQDYIIDVRGNPSSSTSYTLTVNIPPVSAPPPPAAKRIVFPAGATIVSVQGTVAATATDRWVLAAQAGQTMTAQLTFASGQAILIVFGADGNVLLSDHAEVSVFTGVLPSTQDYIIDVRGNPTSSTSYTLTVNIPPR